MLTTEPTQEMIAEWKRLFAEHRHTMGPNRRSGAEVDAYFQARYPHERFNSPDFCQMVAAEILENDFSRQKLSEGVLPEIRSYTVGDVLVGIDVSSGAFHVESEDMDRAIQIQDDLFVYRGLDEADLNNFFLVAEYVRLTGR